MVFENVNNAQNLNIQDVGEYKARLTSKEGSLSDAVTNTEAIGSTIENTDFAREQMELVKLQNLELKWLRYRIFKYIRFAKIHNCYCDKFYLYVGYYAGAKNGTN